MRKAIRVPIALGVALTVAGTACESTPLGPEVGPLGPPDVTDFVTGAALESLDSDGRFRMPEPWVDSPYAIISRAQAAEFALGVIRTWLANPDVITLPGTTSLVEVVEAQHGAPIAWNKVALGPSLPHFAESHLVPLPETADGPTIRHFGPHFLVPMYVGETPVITISVSAHATNVYLTEEGFVRRLPGRGGGEFWAGGVPLDLEGLTVPPYPETAVAFVYGLTGIRVAEVPVLGVPGNRVSRLASRWRIRLAEPVEFERLVDGERVIETEVFVGLHGSIADARAGATWIDPTPQLRVYVAAPTQPASEEVGPSLHVALREGYAVDLHEVRVLR